MGSNNRIASFDFVKFIAIFMVLWGHIIQYLLPGICYENAVYQVIYSFHMPLFMIVTGYFSTSSLKRSFFNMFQGKVNQLIIPGIFITIIHCVLMKYNTGGGVVLERIIFDLWYLKATFLCYIVFYLGRYCGKYKIYYYIGSILISQIVFVYQFNLMFPCFMLGVFLRNNWNFIMDKSKFLMILNGILFFTLLIPWDESFWILPSGEVYPLQSLNSLSNFYVQFYYRMLIGIVGSLFFILLADVICKKYSENFLINHFSSMGKETLAIYLFQYIIIETLLWRWLKSDNYNITLFSVILAPILSLAVLYFCVIIRKMVRRSKVAAFIFLGERING